MDDKGVIPQLNYTSTEYIGTGKVGDEQTLRIKVTLPSGRTSVQQYSAVTGFLVYEETTSKQRDTEVPITVEYKDYKKIGNIMVPHTIIRNIGGQELSMKFSDIKLNEGVTEADFK